MERYPVILDHKPMKTSFYLAVPTKEIVEFIRLLRKEINKVTNQASGSLTYSDVMDIINRLAGEKLI